jgi:D-amino peptidase
MHTNILIISDIEGSSGCWDYESSSFLKEKWAFACLEMSLDVNAVAEALFKNGAERIIVKDFHRTGYNLLPEFIHPRVKLVSGYRTGPVPGLGDPESSTAVMMLGMHSASGSGGFLAHTMTSRIKKLTVNEELMSEIELFAASLAPWNISPVFFSGCPVACLQAEEAVKNISTYPIDKSHGEGSLESESWRKGLAEAAVKAMGNHSTVPFKKEGPFKAILSMREGSEYAGKLAARWGFSSTGNKIFIKADDMNSLYYSLIRLCYLTPVLEKILPLGIRLYNLWGRLGQSWVRYKIKKSL